jgi:hypothetical protein
VLITLQQPLDTEQLTFLTTELEFSGEVPTEAAPNDVVESIEQHLALSTNTTEASSLLCEAVPLPAKALPTSAFSLANLPCKFGKHCAKGAACLLGSEPPHVAEHIAEHVIIWPVRKLAQSACELQPCPQDQSITNHHRCNDCYLIQPSLCRINTAPLITPSSRSSVSGLGHGRHQGRRRLFYCGSYSEQLYTQPR